MKNIIKSAVLGGVLLLASCSSPLSDIEVNDSNVLYPKFTVSKEWKDGSDHHTVSAYIGDKNGASVNLKNGTVSVNGENMHYSGNRYGSNEKFKTGKDYNFVVTLPDSTTYKGSVQGAVQLKSIKWPKFLEKNKSAHMSWMAKKGKNVSIELRVQDDKNFWQTVHEYYIGDANKYFLELPKMDFPEKMNGKAELILTNTQEGTIDENFGGGSAKSVTKYTKSFTIK